MSGPARRTTIVPLAGCGTFPRPRAKAPTATSRTPTEEARHALHRLIDIDVRPYLWRDLVALRQAQAQPRAEQPVSFVLHVDHRPPGERNAAERYREPSLFTCLEPPEYPLPCPAFCRARHTVVASNQQESTQARKKAVPCSTPRGERASMMPGRPSPRHHRVVGVHRVGQGRRALCAAAPQARAVTHSASFSASKARGHPLRRPSAMTSALTACRQPVPCPACLQKIPTHAAPARAPALWGKGSGGNAVSWLSCKHESTQVICKLSCFLVSC